MAEYTVECVDRENGLPYTVRVAADTYQQAVAAASKDHIAGKAHRIDSSPIPQGNGQVAHSQDDELRKLLIEQTHYLRRLETWSMRMHVSQESLSQMVVRAVVYTITAMVVLAAVGGLFVFVASDGALRSLRP